MSVQIKKSMPSDSNTRLLTVENTNATTRFDTLRWKFEINRLINNASTETDKKALSCFGDAIKPLLDDPKRLRTLLGKITMIIN